MTPKSKKICNESLVMNDFLVSKNPSIRVSSIPQMQNSLAKQQETTLTLSKTPILTGKEIIQNSSENRYHTTLMTLLHPSAMSGK